MDETSIRSIVGFENKGIFHGIDSRYIFGIISFKNSGQTSTLRAIFDQQDVNILQNVESHTLSIPRTVLTEYSPEAKTFPNITDNREVGVLEKILSYPSLREDIPSQWNARPRRELDRTRAADRFVENPEEGDYPVYQGKNIYQYIHNSELSNETAHLLCGV